MLPIIQHSCATPLTNIILNTQLASQNAHQKSPASPDMYLQRVLLNAQHLQNTLRLAESPNSQSFSPENALQELLALNEGAKLKQQLVSRIFIPRPTRIRGSQLAFQEIAVCLLNNAYESYAQTKRHKLVFLSAVVEKELFKLSVADGGQGMSWWQQKISTQQWYSSKQRHSGLGLFFVKKTLEQEFGGHFQLRSRRGRGTVITACFPLKGHQSIPKPFSGLNY